MKPRFTLYDFTHDNHVRGNKVQNQKQGHFSLFRSLLAAEWAKDPIKLAVWIRLLSDASFRVRSVDFVGKSWTLQPGELVTTTGILAKRIHDNEGKPIPKRQVLRILKSFERQNMIQMTSNPFATIIFITNYCEYQEVEPGTPSGTPIGTPCGTPNANNGAGLKVVGGTPPGTPSGIPQGTQNNTGSNTDPLKISSSRAIKTGSLKGSRSNMRPEMAVQSPTGKFWGTSEDLRLAEWIFSLITQINPAAKEPNWAAWANDVRLIRFSKDCDHRTIAKTFKWANSDGFWQTNVLSPSKLRRHWETIYPKSQQLSKKPEVSNDRITLDFDNSDWAEGLEL